MAQVVRFTRALSNTMVTDIQTALDAGSGAMTINLYDGTMPSYQRTGGCRDYCYTRPLARTYGH